MLCRRLLHKRNSLSACVQLWSFFNRLTSFLKAVILVILSISPSLMLTMFNDVSRSLNVSSNVFLSSSLVSLGRLAIAFTALKAFSIASKMSEKNFMVFYNFELLTIFHLFFTLTNVSHAYFRYDKELLSTFFKTPSPIPYPQHLHKTIVFL